MRRDRLKQSLVCLLAVVPGLALAFDSGSTGADGAFSPTVNTEVQLPPSGVFNFTTINIPTGVTVTFRKNAANTPVALLASGNVTIAGVLDVRGTKGFDSGAAGTGNVGDDGQPGTGGPGGFDGGRGGPATSVHSNRGGGSGLGPGGGGYGYTVYSGSTPYLLIGGGGAFGASPGTQNCNGVPGTPYGSSLLLPLIGGSGGGGGAGGLSYAGAGGGGGGGAILIAASGTISVTGSVLANGGAGGASTGDGRGASGGGASGGAIRLVATTISGNGTINATAGGWTNSDGPTADYYVCSGAGTGSAASAGSVGRIRFEAETITRTAASTPTASVGTPGNLFVAGLPALTISSVAGVGAPANPTGNADITLPAGTANPVTVVFTATGVPVGNTVKLTVTPAFGEPITALSPALAGTTASATASVQVSLPVGPSVLQAQTTYTIVAALGDALSTYANNERVEKITLTATPGKPATVTLVTVSGKEFPVPASVLAGVRG